MQPTVIHITRVLTHITLPVEFAPRADPQSRAQSSAPQFRPTSARTAFRDRYAPSEYACEMPGELPPVPCISIS